jgi:hypothetical protein
MEFDVSPRNNQGQHFSGLGFHENWVHFMLMLGRIHIGSKMRIACKVHHSMFLK